MKTGISRAFGLCMSILILAVPTGGEVWAHGGGNWDPFTIDGVNKDARGKIIACQALMSEVIRGRIGRDEWPLATFRETRDAMITVKEEIDEILEHYVIDGVDIRLAAALRAEPRAGRTVAASQALDAGIALLDHAASLDSADTFVKEFYAGRLATRLYELLEAHGDRMALYAAMTVDKE